MKKIFNINSIIAFVVAVIIICGAFMSVVSYNKSDNNAVYASDDKKVIIMQIGNSKITVDDKEEEIDTVPVVVSGRTLVPIRAVVEAMGGSADWNNDLKEAVLTCNDNVIKLVIDSTEAFLNNEKKVMDTAPAVINGRTMIPLRFVAEGFKFNVDWNAESQTITITNDTSLAEKNNEKIPATNITENNKPVVYMTTDISPEGLMAVYNKLGFEPIGKVAVKLSTGEPPASNYLDPNLIKDLVQSVDGTIVECNTAYETVIIGLSRETLVF